MSLHPEIEAIVSSRESGELEIRCPGPARVRWQRARGESLVEGSRLGLLRRDERTHELVLPAGARGRLQEILLPDPWTPCEHGHLLGVLGPQSGDDAAAEAAEADAASGFVVRAPTHGTFYQRPAPDQPAYVEPGQAVSRGDTLGLIEVMKCFSPIVFEPPPGRETGRVLKLVAPNASEVRVDQELVRIELDGA